MIRQIAIAAPFLSWMTRAP